MLMNIDSCTLYCISFIVATKAELLEQVEELSSVKDEMTKEVTCFWLYGQTGRLMDRRIGR